MGAGASAIILPEGQVDHDAFKRLAGNRYSKELFDHYNEGGFISLEALEIMRQLADVYISYERNEDRVRVLQIKNALEVLGLSTCIPDRTDDSTAGDWATSMQHCSIFLYFVSTNYVSVVDSQVENFCRAEFTYALDAGKIAIPVLLEESMKDANRWTGPLEKIVGNNTKMLPSNAVEVFEDFAAVSTSYFQDSINELYRVITATTKPLNSTAGLHRLSSIQTSLPTHVIIRTQGAGLSEELLIGHHRNRPLKNVPAGVAFLSLVNSAKRFFLPTSENYFDGLPMAKVLCDSGCSSHLLPIGSPEVLRQIFSKFGSRDQYAIELRRANTADSATSFLSVESINFQEEKFEVKLCTDIVGTSNAIMIKRLCFFLCTDDILDIQQSYTRYLDDDSIVSLSTATGPQKRRTHALLGQDILMKFCIFKFRHVELYVDANKYQLPTSFTTLRGQIKSLETQLRTKLPDRFDEWERDDFVFYDEEKLDLTDELFID